MAQQNQGVAVADKKQSLATILSEERFKSRFDQVLGKRAPQFISSLIQIGQSMEDVEPMSIIAAGMTAAALDLPVNKNLGFAWIVPYATGYGQNRRKLAQFQCGWKGYVQLALRSNQYKHINVCPVREGELVKNDRMRAIIELDPAKKTSETIVGYCGYIMLINGYEHAEYWTVDEVLEHGKQYSQAFRYSLKENKKDSMWETDFDSMACKTVISLLIRKWGIMSIDMQRAVKHDHGVQIDVDSEVTFIDNQPEIKAPLLPEGSSDVPQAAAKTYDKPYAELTARLKSDDVTEPQVLAVLKQMGLADASIVEVLQVSDAKLNQVLNAWPNLLPQFKAVKA